MADRRRKVHASGSKFDKLPDELVGSILDGLNWHDVVITSTLSRRFYRIWKSFLDSKKKLILEDDTYKPGSSMGFMKNIFRRPEFVEFVNHILSRHKGSKVNSLRIAFNDVYLHAFTPDFLHENFENWLTFARAKSVRSLDITLGRSLWVSNPRFHMVQGFDKLTSVSLKSVNVSDEDLKHGLKSHLINLESLMIEDAPDLKNVVVDSSKLKQLEIRWCSDIQNIDIDAPNLQYFKYQYHNTCTLATFCFLHVPKLSHVSLSGGALCQKKLPELEKVGMLEKLEMDLTPRCKNREHDECKITPPYFPLLSNLKQLELAFSMNGGSCIPLLIFSVILAACPNLHKLTLKYKIYDFDLDTRRYWYDLKKDELRARSHTHQCLKEVEFIDCHADFSLTSMDVPYFYRKKMEVLAVDYLKEIAPNLEKTTHRIGQ